jgi:hypothetical protein
MAALDIPVRAYKVHPDFVAEVYLHEPPVPVAQATGLRCRSSRSARLTRTRLTRRAPGFPGHVRGQLSGPGELRLRLTSG